MASPIFVLLKFRSSGEIVIGTSSDILNKKMELSRKSITEALGLWKDGNEQVQVKWPTPAALEKNPDRIGLAEKDHRIYTAFVLGFSGHVQELVNLKDKFTAKRTTPSIVPINGANADDEKTISPSVSAEKPAAKKSLSTSSPGGPPSKKSRSTNKKQTESQIMAAVNQHDSESDLLESEDDESEKEDSTEAGDKYTHPQSPSMFTEEEENGSVKDYATLKALEDPEEELEDNGPKGNDDEDEGNNVEQLTKEEMMELLAIKDEQIKSLQAELEKTQQRLMNDPSFLVQELKVALELAKSLDRHSPYSLPPTPGSSSSFSPGQQPGRRVADGSTEVKKVPLYKGCHLKLDPTHFKLACSYGISEKKEKGKRNVVFKIMESIYSEEYMAEHSTSGRPAPGKTVAKPSLPKEDMDAISSFVIAQWKKWHQLDCEESSVMKAIQDKLSGEHRKKELRLKRIATASKNAAPNTDALAEK